MRQLVIALMLSASAHSQAAANESMQADINSLDNLSNAYAVCAAYSTVIQDILVNAGDTETAEKYRLQSIMAYRYANEYTEQGRTDELAKELTRSSIQTHAQAMLEAIRNDASNLAILVKRHSYKCKEAIAEPEAFRKLFQPETQ